MIEIDGSLGEGGGQILRSSLTLSLMTGQPFRITRIRANRKPKPGLQAQHLASVRAAKEVGRAKTVGDSLGSQELTFEPTEVRAGKYHFAIGTAGSTSLVLQTVYLPLLLKPKERSSITIEGGTHVPTSPCFSFLKKTWLAHLRKLGVALDLQMVRPGFYPRGGGRVDVGIDPVDRIWPWRMTESDSSTSVRVLSAVAGLPTKIAVRQADRAVQRLEKHGFSPESETDEWPGGPASYLDVQVTRGGVPSLFTAVGSKGKSAEAVADEAVEAALPFLRSDALIDPHSADQLLLPLACCPEGSSYRTSEVTLHLKTNVDIIRRFLSRDISVSEATGIVEIGPSL
jgi:RNA 3'-phosphate cyclase